MNFLGRDDPEIAFRVYKTNTHSAIYIYIYIYIRLGRGCTSVGRTPATHYCINKSRAYDHHDPLGYIFVFLFLFLLSKF